MEDRRSKKRKVEEVQFQQDRHWVGEELQAERKKKQKKQKKKEYGKLKDTGATPSSGRDHVIFEQKISTKKLKFWFCEDLFVEEGEEASNGSHVYTDKGLDIKKKANNSSWKLKEHEQAQEDQTHDVHLDCNANFDMPKQRHKKVRFFDQCASCKYKHNLSEEACIHNSESSANGCSGQPNFTVSCSCKKESSKEVPSQDGSMSSNTVKVEMAVDEKSFLACRKQKDEDDWVWGKRFTPEEDELLKNAVLDYIKVKGWKEKEGIDKVLNCRKHKEAHNCWGVIRLCLPHRPRKAIRSRAFLLLEEGTHLGYWSKEEEGLLKRLQKEHGNRWKYLAPLIGRSQYSISRKWRCLKRPKPTGVWTLDEIQKLSDSVQKCLRLRALGLKETKGNHKFLRDNISWDEVADAIGTHTHDSCCVKWYRNMSSSMVIDGLWASEDDCLLLKSLLESGACTEEEVEWQSLLSHRSGQACSVRWKQMVKYLGEKRTLGFLEKLDSLVCRYAPELLSHET